MPLPHRPLASSTAALLTAGVLAAAVLTGCSSGADGESSAGPSTGASTVAEPEAPVVQLGGPGEENRTLSPEEAQQIEAPQHTDADVAFVHAMIPHHQQALELTAMIDGRSESTQLPQLAERLEVSQTDELGQLETWLTDRGEPLEVEGGGHGDHAMMPGMLTEAELAELRAAEGRRFDRMWLAAMVRHHEGAVRMVEELLSTGNAAIEPATSQLVNHIASDQLVEIARMEQMLADGAY
jgi:uncharacterized protein (DUF305 family)